MAGGKEVTEEQLMEMLRSQVGPMGNTGNTKKYFTVDTQLGEMGLAEMEALLKQGMTPRQVQNIS